MMPQGRGLVAKPSAEAALAQFTTAYSCPFRLAEFRQWFAHPWLVTLLLYTLAGIPEPRLPWTAGLRVSPKKWQAFGSHLSHFCLFLCGL
jgi:hypothetical protein